VEREYRMQKVWLRVFDPIVELEELERAIKENEQLL